MSFRLVPKSVTLNDIERRNSRYFATFQRIRVPCRRTAFAISSPDEFLYLNVFIVSASGGKKLIILGNFWYLGDSCTDPLLPMRTKFGVLEQIQGLHLQAKYHLNVFVVSASGGQKPQFWANFDILGGSCTDPLLPMRTKFGVLEQIQGLHLQAKFHLKVLIVSASGGQKPQFRQILTFRGLLYRPPFYR